MTARILFCSQTAHVGGGIETWLQTLANGLLERGHDVRLALARGGRFHDPERWLVRHPFPRHRVSELDGRLGLREARTAAVWRALEREDPDVVVPVGLADVLYAVAARRRRRARLVTCLHGQTVGPLLDLVRCGPRIDTVVSVSRLAADRLVEDHGLPRDRVRHIPVGVEPPVRGHARAGGSGVLRAAYVGRLDCREKRALDVVRLAEALRDEPVELLVAGEGEDAALLRSEASRRGVDARIAWLGFVPHSELEERVYSRVDAVLGFSPAEGSPMALTEGMLAGCVPVVSDYEGRREEGIVRHGETGLVFDVGDTAGAARALLSLRDEPLRRRLSDAARALPSGYRLEGFLGAWEAVVREALARPPRGGAWDAPSLCSPGRLARWLPGVTLTLAVRRWLSRVPSANEPGGEWPHTYEPDSTTQLPQVRT